MRGFYQMAKTKKAKAAVCVGLVGSLVGFNYYMSRADAAELTHVVPNGGGTYHWSHKKAHHQIQDGELRPLSVILSNGKKVHGHAYCKRGYYPTVSKYTGMSCVSKKAENEAQHFILTCVGDTFIGAIFGGEPGAGAGLTGCVFSKMSGG